MTDNTEALPPLDALFRENSIPMNDRNGALYDAISAALAQRQHPTSLDDKPELLEPCVLPGHEGEWMAEDGRRFVLAQRQQVPEARLEAAFREGYFSRETYNDKDVTDVDEQWEKARAALTAAPSAQLTVPAEWENWSRAQDAAQAAPSAQAEPVAWMHPDGRVVPAATKEAGRIDGGAMRSSLAGYTIPLYAVPPAAQAEPQESLSDGEIKMLMANVWRGDYDTLSDYGVAIVRAYEKSRGIGEQEGK